MTYDGFDGYVLMVSGGTTYRYSPAGWLPLHPTSEPPATQEATMTYDAHDGYVVYYGGYATSSYNQLYPRNYTWAYRGGVWTNLTGTIAPPDSRGATITYDSWDHYVLLFNGLTTGGTWRFSAGNWTAVPPVNSSEPSPRYAPAFLDDPRDRYVLLFGGASVAPQATCNLCPNQEDNDTWVYRSGAWWNLTASVAVSPSPRNSAIAVFDPVVGADLLWAGRLTAHAQNAPADGWSFSSGRWTTLNTTGANASPPYQWGAAATFDESTNEVLAFGGFDDFGVPTDRVWTYASSAWSIAFSLQNPPPLSFDSMTYDARDGYVLLFDSGGGSDFNGGGFSPGPESQTWTFLDGTWNQLDLPLEPSARSGASMAYDPTDGYVVLFGGSGPNGGLNDTWTFSGGRWTNITTSVGPAPPPRDSAGFTWDSEDGYLLLFGGYNWTTNNLYGRDDTWSFLSGVWTDRTSSGATPGIRYGTSLADDPSDGYVLLFGGEWGCDGACDGWVYYNDTWTYRGGTWTIRNLSVAPPTRGYEVLSDDPTSGAVFLFGGVDYGSVAPNSTWAFYHGNWTELYYATSPSDRFGTSYATDPLDRGILAFGGTDFTQVFRDTWLYQSSPFVARPSATPDFGTTPLNVSFAQASVGGTGPFAYNWRFGDGANASGSAVSHMFDSPGLYWSTLNATDSGGNWSESALPIAVTTNLTAYATADVTNGTGLLQVELLGSAADGAPPYNYTWTFGDGSPGGAGPFIHHVFEDAGEYRAVLTVRDGTNNTASAGVDLRVGPAPLLVGITANITRGDAPVAVGFNASVEGGVPTYNLTWSFGDGGVAYGSAPTHLFTAPGNYVVRLSAIDASGTAASGNISVDVSPTLTLSANWVPRSETSPALVDYFGNLTGGQGPYSVLWDFGDGTDGVSVNGSHVYAAAGSYHATLRASDSNGRAVTAGPFFTTVIAPAPALYATLAAPTAPVAPKATLTLVATHIGGEGPFHYAWTGLPTGCEPADASQLSCRPAVTGTFTIDAMITDAVGQSSNASAQVTVVDPSISLLLVIDPNPAQVNVTSLLRAVPLGGTPPFAFSWSGLPTGCVPSETANLTCTPMAGGIWHIGVSVADPYGLIAAANGTMVVQPAPATTPTAGPTSPPWGWVAIGLVIGAGVVAATYVVLAALRRPRA